MPHGAVLPAMLSAYQEAVNDDMMADVVQEQQKAIAEIQEEKRNL